MVLIKELHDAIGLTDSFVFVLDHCLNSEPTSSNRISAGESHNVTLASNCSP